MGGTLAEIRSLHEQSLLSSLSSVDSAWIGLKSPSRDEKWGWLSGKARKMETREDFWTRNDAAIAADERCAAIDARGTRYNVAVRNCHDALDYICEFKSVNEAPEICTVRSSCPHRHTRWCCCWQEELYLIERDTENSMPSIQQCINSTDVPDDTADFFDIRIKENDAPVFCPMNLENPMDNAESICCEHCLAALKDVGQQSGLEDEAAVDGEDESTSSSAHRAHYAHSLFLFISFSLPFFLIGCFDADLL